MKKSSIIISILATITAVNVMAQELPLELKRIEAARQRQQEKLDKQYVEALQKQRLVYIKRGDIDSVGLIDTILVDMIDAQDIVDTASKRANVKVDYDVVRLKKGTRVYSNKGGVYYGIPEEYEGVKVCNVRYETPAPAIAFKVTRAGMVEIIHSKSDVTRMCELGWNVVDEGFWGYKDVKEDGSLYVIMTKYFDKGEHVIEQTKRGMRSRIILR